MLDITRVKDKRHSIHPLYDIILRGRDEPKSLRTQYQVINESKLWKKPKGFKSYNDKLELERYPKKSKPNFEKNLRLILLLVLVVIKIGELSFIEDRIVPIRKLLLINKKTRR